MKLLKTMIAVIILLCVVKVFAIEPKQEKGMTMKMANKKILVVYFSRSGNTKKVAIDIASALNADIEQLIDKKDRRGIVGYLKSGRDASTEKLADLEPTKNDPSKYDLVVLGTPIWAWTMTPAIRTYILENKSSFKDIACFTTAGGTKAEKIVEKMEVLATKKAIAFTGFVGSDYSNKNKTQYDSKLNSFIDKLQ